MAKLMVPTCWPGANMQKCPRWPFFPTYGWGVKGQKGQIFKQCQMAKLTVPTCWPRSNMQKCPRWPFCPTYGSGVIGQICQNSPIPIWRSNYKHQIFKTIGANMLTLNKHAKVSMVTFSPPNQLQAVLCVMYAWLVLSFFLSFFLTLPVTPAGSCFSLVSSFLS